MSTKTEGKLQWGWPANSHDFFFFLISEDNQRYVGHQKKSTRDGEATKLPDKSDGMRFGGCL